MTAKSFSRMLLVVAAQLALLATLFAQPVYAQDIAPDSADDTSIVSEQLAANTSGVEAQEATTLEATDDSSGEGTEDSLATATQDQEVQSTIAAAPSNSEQADAPENSSSEVDPASYDATALLEDESVYSIAPTDGSSIVLEDSEQHGTLASGSNYLRGYWRVENHDDGNYSFYNLDNNAALGFDEAVVEGTRVAFGDVYKLWKLLLCKDGSYNFAPQENEELRLGVTKDVDGAIVGLSLVEKLSDAVQHFILQQHQPLTEALRSTVMVEDGLYRIDSALKKNFSVDIAGASTKDKANAQAYAANDTLAQRFWVRSQGNGLYTFTSASSNKMLDLAGAKKDSGTNVWQYTGNDTLAQLFYLVKDGSYYSFRSAVSGLALDVKGASTKNGANIQTYAVNGTKAQQFSLKRDSVAEESLVLGKRISDGIYSLYSLVGSNKVLDIAGAKQNNGANAQIYTANKSFAQKFEIRRVYGNFYTIRAANSAKYLDVAGGSSASGANVQQWSGGNVRAQLWYFIPNGSNFEIRSSVAGNTLDVSGAKNANGANVDVYIPNSTQAQIWNLKEVPLLENGTYVFVSSLSPIQWIEVSGASKSNSANVRINHMARTNAQHWKISWSKGVYTIKNVHSGKALDVKGGSKSNSANVQQYASNGSAAQQWRMWIAGDGGVRLQNVGSGKYLDVKGGKASSGTNVHQYASNTTKAQVFVPISVNDSLVTKGKTGWQNPSHYYQVSAYNVALPNYSRGIFAFASSSRISPNATRSQVVEAFIARAYNYLGTRYVWDYACAPGVGVDCAGLVLQCMYAVGITPNKYTPHDHYYTPGHDHYANDMWADPKIQTLSFASRRRGDLICYSGHIAIYLGNDQILHAYPGSTFIANVYSTGLPIRGVKRLFV